MWRHLSVRQRRVLLGLGAANAILLGTIGVLALAPEREPEPAARATVVPAATRVACQAHAARALSDHGVAGSVAIPPDGSIEVTLGGQDATHAWDAFAVAAELAAVGCGPYDPVRVDAPDPSRISGLRLVVEARWADVQAWSQGIISDDVLSQRAARSSYTQPVSPIQPGQE